MLDISFKKVMRARQRQQLSLDKTWRSVLQRVVRLGVQCGSISSFQQKNQGDTAQSHTLCGDTEEKVKVVAAVWRPEFIQILTALGIE